MHPNRRRDVGFDESKLAGRSPEHGARHATLSALLISCDCGLHPNANRLVKSSKEEVQSRWE